MDWLRQGRYGEAEEAYRESISIKEKAYGTRRAYPAPTGRRMRAK